MITEFILVQCYKLYIYKKKQYNVVFRSSTVYFVYFFFNGRDFAYKINGATKAKVSVTFGNRTRRLLLRVPWPISSSWVFSCPPVLAVLPTRSSPATSGALHAPRLTTEPWQEVYRHMRVLDRGERHAPDPSLKLIFVNLGFCSTGWPPLTGMKLQRTRQWFETKPGDNTPLTGTLEMRAIFHYLRSSTVCCRYFFSRFKKSEARNRQHNVSTSWVLPVGPLSREPLAGGHPPPPAPNR